MTRQAATRTIAIVGAGFSGTSVAVNLLRHPHLTPTRIVLIDRAEIARGSAYAVREHPYLLNVPAGRMSASCSKPLEFLDFVRRRLPHATAEDFLPRATYGDYLEALLAAAEHSAAPHLRLERLRRHAVHLERIRHRELRGDSDISRLRLRFDDGSALLADEVVLALGNPPPARLLVTQTLLGSPRYTEDPWRGRVAFQPGETVLVIGTGLTMADIVLAGADAAGGKVIVHAISRHGLLAPDQAAAQHGQCRGDGHALLQAATFSVRRLVRAVRELIRLTQARGGDWRDAITFVRTMAPSLWRRMPLRERQRFLRHVRSYWDAHRHRVPVSARAALERLRREQVLHLHAGRLLDLREQDRHIRATWRGRGSATPTALLVDRVINCTGPDYDPKHSGDKLLQSLLQQGLACADTLGLGLRTAAHGALVAANGQAAPDLYYIGPMLRATHWETTAVPELREHAERLAWALSAFPMRRSLGRT